MTQELGRDTPAWLLPVPEWWVSLCRVTRGQSRTSRLSRVNSHTSALVDVEIWVHMETKEDNDRMKSCSDVCVCVCVVYIVCVPGNKQRKAKSQTIWDAESHAKSLAPLPSSWAPVFVCVCVCVCVLVTQSCPTLCSPPGFSVHGILQIRILEYWVASPFSRGFSRPRDRTWIS